jgi:hypothetical protein
MLAVGAAYGSYLNYGSFNYCAEPGVVCTKDNLAAVRASDGFQSYEADIKTKAAISGVGLGSGVVLAGVAGWLFWREANKDSVAHVTVPSADGTGTILATVALPPVSLATAPQRFPNR